jgi:hypothetical protein
MARSRTVPNASPTGRYRSRWIVLARRLTLINRNMLPAGVHKIDEYLGFAGLHS